MIEILCTNSNCRTVFKFHEDKNPSAQKVMCPKCKNIQAIQARAPDMPEQQADVDDWFALQKKQVNGSANLVQGQGMEIAAAKNQVDEFDFFADSVPKKPFRADEAQPLVRERRSIYQNPTEFGWLVVHDEFTKTHTFPLREGINRIGRYSDAAVEDINISIMTNDTYMSRYHCDLEVRKNNRAENFEYFISDKASRTKKQSTNGTYINASHRRLTSAEEVALIDGDTIQLGATKLVLKTPIKVNNAAEAEKIVQEADYTKTVIF